MLQIRISNNDKYSLAEAAQMAVEAGAMWLVLAPGELSDEEVCLYTDDIISLCRDGGIILTIENRVELAKKLGVHGVFLRLGQASPVAVREEFGPEAIVGVEIGMAETALSLEKADIDYVALVPDNNSAAIISQLRSLGSEIPVVAYMPGSTLADADIKSVMAQGFSGICGGDGVFESDSDPVEDISKMLQQIDKA